VQEFPAVSGRRWSNTINLVAMLTAVAVFGGRPAVSYKALSMGADTVQLGIIAASFAGLAAAIAVPVGRSTDRRGGRRVLIAGLATLTVSMLLVALADSIVTLAASQLLLGAGHLAVVLGCQSMLTASTADDQHPRLIGTYTAATSGGQVIGPTASGAFITNGGHVPVTFFLLAAAWSALSILPVLRWVPNPSGRDTGPKDGRPSVAETIRRPGMVPAMVGGVSGLLALDLLVAYLPGYGTLRGISPQAIGIALSTLAVCQLLARFMQRRLLAAAGPTTLLAASVLIPGLAIPVLILPLHTWQVMAVMAVIGLALGICQPMSLVLAVLSSPPAARGVAMGLRIAGNRLSVFLLPVLMGVTLGQFGIPAILGGLAVIMVGAGGYVGRGAPAAG
jgi:MFS family permease